MLAAMIAGVACLAGVSGLLTSLRTADSNLRALQAHAAVRSVAERLQAVDYLSLYQPELPVDVPSRPGSSLTVGSWNSRTDDFRNTPDNLQDDLEFRVRPFVTRVTHANGADYAQVDFQYEWTDSSFFASRVHTDTYTMLMAPISTY